MKTQVLQGKNLEYDITTIKITLDASATPAKPLLDLIQSFHPIFMDAYDVIDDTIIIRSKLPHLWKEKAEPFNKLATGVWTEEETKKFLLEEVIKRQVNSMSTIPLLYTAHKLGYETTQFYTAEGLSESRINSIDRHYVIGIGQESQIVVSSANSKDSHIAQKSQKDKYTTNTVLDRLCLPIAKWQVISSREQLKDVIPGFPKPFVLKPCGLTGGSGVSTGLNTVEQAEHAYDLAHEAIYKKERPTWQQKIMIQQQVEGEDYRLLVINGKFMVATKRIPAYVIGDGVSNIKQLIETTNSDPRRDVTNPAHTLKPIVFDQMLTDYLAEQNLSFEYVPAKDEKVRVRKPASMSLGGLTEDFTELVHPQIRAIAESIAQTLHAFTVGVDLFCKDVSKPLTIENGSILEINTMPEMYLNIFPAIGRQYDDVLEYYVKSLIGDKPKTKKVVLVGTAENPVPAIGTPEFTELLSANGITKEDRVGIYRGGATYIGDTLISSSLESWRAIESLKINSSLSAIVLVYESTDEVKEVGYGFDNL